VKRALEEPIRQIVEKVKSETAPNRGYDADSMEYVDMVQAGIIDPTKVERVALQNAASIASLLLTTEALITDVPEEKSAAPPAMPHGVTCITRRVQSARCTDGKAGLGQLSRPGACLQPAGVCGRASLRTAIRAYGRGLAGGTTPCPHLHSYPQAPELHGGMRFRGDGHQKRRPTRPQRAPTQYSAIRWGRGRLEAHT
jgi:hypothetical protein